MDKKIDASFIPKKNFDTEKRVKKTTSIFFLISVVIFSFTLISSIGVFLYETFLENSIDEGSIMLERERDNFDIESIQIFTRLDKRFTISEKLLNEHIDLSAFFDLLEKSTLKNIQFKSLDLKVEENNVMLIMEGVARSYSTVALQSDVFGEHLDIKDSIFSNLDVNKNGDVTFDFSASIDKDLILYKNNIE